MGAATVNIDKGSGKTGKPEIFRFPNTINQRDQDPTVVQENELQGGSSYWTALGA